MSFVYEGYWASSANPAEDSYKGKYPWPAPSPQDIPQKEEILSKLDAVQKACRSSSGAEKMCLWANGESPCRLCPPGTLVGEKEYRCKLPSGDTLVWPEGLEHYINVHNVVPTAMFHAFLMQQ
eukprot:PhF_6_TR35157/c0_g1_i1/m.51225